MFPNGMLLLRKLLIYIYVYVYMYMIYLYEKYRSVTNCTNIDMIYVTVLFPNMLLIIYEEKN